MGARLAGHGDRTTTKLMMKTTTTGFAGVETETVDDRILRKRQEVNEAVDRAIAQLIQSGRGKRAADGLRAFLVYGGYGLDSENQAAIQTLIRVFFHGYSGTVIDKLEELK